MSVVVPAHDPGELLARALASVVAQDFAEWECIVVDDGSVQDLSWVGNLDPRIRLVRQPQGGAADARNRGMAEATQPLIAFCDADDEWLPEKLGLQVRSLGQAALCYTAFERVDGTGHRVGPGYDGAAGYSDLLLGNGICTSTVMVRSDAVGSGFDTALTLGEDWDLWLRIAQTHRITSVDRVLVRYREHAGQTSRDYRALWRDARTVLARHDHPNARRGRRRLSFLAGVQAYDRARETRRLSPFVFALVHAPGYTVRAQVRWTARAVGRHQPRH